MWKRVIGFERFIPQFGVQVGRVDLEEHGACLPTVQKVGDLGNLPSFREVDKPLRARTIGTVDAFAPRPTLYAS